MNNLQEIYCTDCGASLGYQEAGTAVYPEMWVHTRCPVRTARNLGLDPVTYGTLFNNVGSVIGGAYPDFPNNFTGDPSAATVVRTLRSSIAAGAVLEYLANHGYQIKRG
jgi:hypothetical protein